MRRGLIAIACLLTTTASIAQSPRSVDWPGVGNDPGCMRYSRLDQINRENVARLKPAWTYHTRRARGPHGQDDRVHADRGRRRDVRHHRISPRRGPRRGDRQGALAVRSAQGSSVRAPAGVRRRQPGLRLLVRRQARRRAADHSRHVGRAAVLAGREDRQARPEVRRRRHPQPPQGARPEGRRARLRADVGAGRSGRIRSSSASPAAKGPASPRRGTSARSTSAPASEVWRFRTVPRPGRVRATRPGKAIPGRTAAARTPGAGSASTSIAAWSSPGSGRPPSTSTAATGTATTCSRTARSRSTPGRASGSGTSRRCITTSGTTTCRSIPTSSRSPTTASRSTPSRR